MAGFNFEDELGGLDDASLMDVLGLPTTPSPAPAPSPVVSAPAQAPAPLFSYVAPAAAPTPVSQPPQGLASLVQAAPAPQPAFVASPVSAPAPSPFGVSLDQVAGDGLDTLTGSDLGISAPAAQAPAAQAPAPSPSAAPVPQQGYTPYSGELHPNLLKLAPTSGADIYGKWQFDTQADRDRADYEAQYGFNPESGQSTGPAYSGTPKYTYSEPEYDPNGYLVKAGQPTGLDPRYELKDTSGLIHGSKVVRLDPTHVQYTYSFFDPKTGQQAGKPIVETAEIKQSMSDKLADIGMALATSAITGGTLGGQLFNVAKAAGTGNVAGAITGALGVAGGAGDILGSDVASAAQLGQKAIGAGSALASGDPLRMLGAAANLTGSEDLASASKAANTAALVNAAAKGNTGAIINLLASGAPTVFNAITGGAGAMTSGEEEERKGAGENYDLLKQLPDNKATTNAVETILKGQDTTVGSGDDLTGGISNEDLDTLLGAGLTGAGSTSSAKTSGQIDDLFAGTSEGTSAGTSAGGEQAGGNLEDQLRNAGIDTGTAGTSTGYTAEGTGADTGEGGGGGDTSEGGEGADTVEGAEGGDSGDVNKNTLSEQAKFLESNVEDQDTINQLLKDYAVDSDQLLGGVGNIGEDFTVTDKGTIKSTYSGEEGYFDADGNFVTYDVRPPYTSGGTGTTGGTGGGTGGTGGTTTKTTSPTTPTTAKSGLDLDSLIALGLLGEGGQDQTPQQQLMSLAGIKSVKDIFKNYYA
jgi:hypothetical protein